MTFRLKGLQTVFIIFFSQYANSLTMIAYRKSGLTPELSQGIRHRVRHQLIDEKAEGSPVYFAAVEQK